MKVLKEGPKKCWGLELQCTGYGNNDQSGACGATLLVEPNDIFSTESSDIGGGHEVYYTFECPICHAWTDISDDKLPSWIKDQAHIRTRHLAEQIRSNDWR